MVLSLAVFQNYLGIDMQNLDPTSRDSDVQIQAYQNS